MDHVSIERILRLLTRLEGEPKQTLFYLNDALPTPFRGFERFLVSGCLALKRQALCLCPYLRGGFYYSGPTGPDAASSGEALRFSPASK
jgi:hypothetical protein